MGFFIVCGCEWKTCCDGEAGQKLIDQSSISGTGNGELNLGADICRALTILDNAGLLDAVTLADVEITEEAVREKNCSN